MRLKRIWLAGMAREHANQWGEFLLFHGVRAVEIFDHPDKRKLEVVFLYAGKGVE